MTDLFGEQAANDHGEEMNVRWYILDGKTPVRCANLQKVNRLLGSQVRHVRDTTLGDVRVSTVFLCLDHSWKSGKPLLFETMIFGGEQDGYQERCSTWDEAEAQHEAAVQLIEKDRAMRKGRK